MSSPPQWIKDGKQMPGSVVKSLVGLGVVGTLFPVYLVTILPFTLVVQIVRLLTKKKMVIRYKPAEGDDRVQIPPGDKIAFKKRTFDVVLLGTTGFTGKLAATYLAKQYGKSGGKLKWAIAGRRKGALESIAKELGMPDLPIIICDTSNEENLRTLVKDTRAVVSTAGPFNLHGTPVVKYCANYGTHYADITGEATWVREMVDRFDAIAKETGARIVHCCGHDCVPWDLMVMLSAAKLKSEFGSDLEKVEMYDRIRSAPSGGTLATAFSLVYAESKYEPSVNYNPMLITHKREKGWATTSFTGLNSVAYSSLEKAWTTMFVMARVNFEVVRRSNALSNYGEKLSYYEAHVHKAMPVALIHFFKVLIFGAVLACPPLLSIVQKFLPQPGSGSSAEAMDAGWLEVSCHARGTKKDAHVNGKLYFKTDPGYTDTARMLVEAGLTLALTEPAKLPGMPGILTPATGLGQPYVERLCSTGTTLTWC
ncbi:hypothetical protein DIPPA_55979 [Diplonema papillatum]|nr:hypothetical protein DIPPA_55979 [Diplonema papillatum]